MTNLPQTIGELSGTKTIFLVWFKGTVSVILKRSFMKDDNARFTKVPLKMWKILSFVICLCSSNAQVIFVKKTKINSFSKLKTSKYNSWLEKALKEIILNRALTS